MMAEVDVEGLINGLPDVLDPSGLILSSWVHLRNTVRSGGGDSTTNMNSKDNTLESDDHNGRFSINESKDCCASLFWHIAKTSAQDINQVLSFPSPDYAADFEKLLAKLEDLYLPLIFVMFGRLIFYSRCRRDGEKVEDYFKVLETLSEMCEFGEDRDFKIKQQFMRKGDITSSFRRLIQESSPLSLKEIFSLFLIQKDTTGGLKAGSSNNHFLGSSQSYQGQDKLDPKTDCQTQKCFQNPLVAAQSGEMNETVSKEKNHVQPRTRRLATRNDFRSKAHNRRKKTCLTTKLVSGPTVSNLGRHFHKRNSKRYVKCGSGKNTTSPPFQNLDRDTLIDSKETEKGGEERFEGQRTSVLTERLRGPVTLVTEKAINDVDYVKVLIEEVERNPESAGANSYSQSQSHEVSNSVGVKGDRTSPFTCQTCKLIFSKVDEYKNHIKVHVCACEICGTQFAYPSLLERHMFKHTGIKRVNKKQSRPKEKRKRKKFFCSSCRVTFPSAVRFKNHMATFCEACQTDCDNHDCDHEKVVKCPGSKKPKRHRCDLCGAAFHGIYELYKHNKMHTTDHSFKCNYCEEYFSDWPMLKEHTAIHTEVASSPDKQGHPFHQISSLSSLTRPQTSSTKKIHECSVCGVRFSKKFYLKNHLRSHSGETPYTCELCGACFKARWNLSRHYLVHTGAKPHTCSICSKSFKWQSTLTTHIKAHHEKRTISQQPHAQRSSPLLQEGPQQQTAAPQIHAPPLLPPPPLHSRNQDSLDLRNTDAVHLRSVPALTVTHQPQQRNLHERFQQHDQHQQQQHQQHHHLQQQLPPHHPPSAVLPDQGRLPGHSHAGVWGPFFGGIPPQRTDWAYWPE